MGSYIVSPPLLRFTGPVARGHQCSPMRPFALTISLPGQPSDRQVDAHLGSDLLLSKVSRAESRSLDMPPVETPKSDPPGLSAPVRNLTVDQRQTHKQWQT